MWRIAIADVIALSGLKGELFAISQLDINLAAKTKNHVILRAPVIGNVAGRVLNHAHADVAKAPGLPKSKSGLAGML